MSDDSETTLETPGLDRLIKAMKLAPPVARVGILGSKSARKNEAGSGPNNAEVGAAHEFGTTKIPQRSFLRVPISDHLAKVMERTGALDQEVLADVIRSGTIIPWVQKIAKLAEGIVIEAFDNSGYGKWVPSIMRYKAVKQTLVETTQLRESITSEVKES